MALNAANEHELFTSFVRGFTPERRGRVVTSTLPSKQQLSEFVVKCLQQPFFANYYLRSRALHGNLRSANSAALDKVMALHRLIESMGDKTRLSGQQGDILITIWSQFTDAERTLLSENKNIQQLFLNIDTHLQAYLSARPLTHADSSDISSHTF